MAQLAEEHGWEDPEVLEVGRIMKIFSARINGGGGGIERIGSLKNAVSSGGSLGRGRGGNVCEYGADGDLINTENTRQHVVDVTERSRPVSRKHTLGYLEPGNENVAVNKVCTDMCMYVYCFERLRMRKPKAERGEAPGLTT